MNTFNLYFRLGYEHIVSFDALDHILFILVLMAVYQPRNWLKILIIVTLFTVGHSVSLALSAYDLINVDKKLIEFLIPLTIVLTGLLNLTKLGQDQQTRSKHWIALFFGIIHGLGFSNYFELLITGSADYWSALLPFNLGVEVGQIVIALCILILMFLLNMVGRVKIRDWNLFISGAAIGIASIICIENWPW